MGKLGTAIAGAFAVKAVVDFGKECVELGSNVSEVQNVVDTAFGDMAYKVEEFANGAIQNFGMSRLAAKKTASTYMAMAKGMGLNAEAAADMSITIAGLTGDVASFYNISQDLAASKLKSVFTGETEALKDLGIVMTQTNLEAYALRQGITKSYSSMTQAEQVALRYGYIMEALALANGDFAKTQDSWANQTRILSMQWQEFMSIVGQMLITVLTPCVRILNEIVSALISVASAINTVISQMTGTQEAVSGAIEESVENQNAMTEATEETAKAQKGMLAGFDEINKLSGGAKTEQADTSATIAVPNVVGGAAQAVDSSNLLESMQKLVDYVSPFREAFVNAFNDIRTVVSTVFNDALLPMFTLVYGAWTDMVTNISDAWNTWAGPIFQKLKEAFSQISDIWADRWNNAIMPVWEKFMSVWDDVWTNHAEPFYKNFVDFVGFFADAALDIYNEFILPIVSWLSEKLAPVFVLVSEKIIDIFGVVMGNIFDSLNNFLNILRGVIDFVTGVLTGDWERAWNGIGTVFKGVINNMIGMVEGFVNFFIRGINNIIGALNTISVDIPDWVPLFGGTKFGINLPSIKEISLPRLAQGAVIPPNQEFLAVLGDQKSGTNIEAPLSTIEQAVENVLRRNGGGEMTLVLDGDLAVLARVLRPYMLKEERRVGVNLVTG